MTSGAPGTIRNAGLLLAQRVAFVASALLFAVLVPRLMGPDLYGRYTLTTSLAFWFVLFSGLGSNQVTARYAPQFVLEGDRQGLQQLFGSLVIVRLLSGALAAGLYLLLTILWLSDLDVWVLVILGGAVLVRAVHDLLFWLFVGLDQAARWGMGHLGRQWLLLAFLIAGFHWAGLRGACWGVLLTELVVLFIGIAWVRSHLGWSGFSLDVRRLTPYLRFGLMNFASIIAFSAFTRSGEAMTRALTGDYRQVAYFGLAYGIYLTADQVMSQMSMASVPLCISLLVKGDTRGLRQWVERLLKGLTVGGVLVVLGVLLLGDDVVPIVLGSDYKPVALDLMVLVPILLTEVLGYVAYVLTLTYEQPKVALTAGLFRLALFWGLGTPLVAWQGSLGTCVAVLLASAAYAAYFTWCISRIQVYSLRGWALAIGLGIPFVPLACLHSSFAVNAAVYGAVVVAYVGLLLAFRVFTPGELARLWQALVSRERTSDANGKVVLRT